MATVNSNVQSGNRIVLTFDSNVIGFAQSFTLNEDYSPEPALGIGDIAPLEYVPTMARYQVHVQKMVMQKETLRTYGIQFENANDALSGRVFDILILDKLTGDMLKKIGGCTYASGNVELRKNAIVMSTVSFFALSVSGAGL